MNELQLVAILKKIAEIEQLIYEDSDGSFLIDGKLAELKKEVREELKEIIWEKYREGKGL